MRYFSVALIALALGSRAEAQIIRPPPRVPQPIGWGSFSLGLWSPENVNDGTTQSVWNFSEAIQYRVALEKPLQSQATIGLTATLARASLSYAPAAGAETGGACPTTCDADANVSQLLASFHAGGGGIGLHQVIELGLGATMYSNFRARTDGTRLPPSSPDVDLALAIGYGVGYSLSPSMQVNLVQDLTLVLHQRTGLAGGTSAMSRQYTTRIGLRVGLGSK